MRGNGTYVIKRRVRLAKYGWIFSALLILYTTLIPFRFYTQKSEILRNFGRIEWAPFFPNGNFIPLTDFVGNIVLFLPIGFFSAVYFSHRYSDKKNLFVTVLLGFGFSLFIEIAQLFFRYRVTSPHDLITNSFGTALGAGIAIIFLKKFFDLGLQIFNKILSTCPHAFLLALFVFFKIFDVFTPENNFTHAQSIGQAWQMTKLIPFVSFSFFQSIENFIFFSIIGLLLSRVMIKGKSFGIIKMFLYLFLFLVATAVIHIVFYRIPGNVNILIFALFGFVAGFKVDGYFKNGPGKYFVLSKNSFLLLFTLIISYIIIDGLYPFGFKPASFSELTIKNFVPFYPYFKITSFLNIKDMFYSFSFSVPIGVVVSYWTESMMYNYQKITVAIIAVFVLSAGVETAQVFIPYRVADITDVLIMVFGGATGAWFFLYYHDFQSLKDKSGDSIK